MNRILIASMKKDAGKTGLAVGLGQVVGQRLGYLKPFGDRLVYRKKSVWDHDCAVMVSVFKLREEARELTIGFEQQKLRYMYDREAIRQRLLDMAKAAEAERDILLIEGGQDFCYGSFVHMDALTVARDAAAKLIVVVSGDENQILDDVTFLRRNVDLQGVRLGGIVVNKVRNLEDFHDTVKPEIERLDVPVLGAIPLEVELGYATVSFYAQRLMARVLGGEGGLEQKVKNAFVGAMSSGKVLSHPLFQKENKLVITAGDRNDMLLAALEGNAVAVLLTNNIIPAPSIVAKFNERQIPLLLTPRDTYSAAMDFHAIDTLLTPEDHETVARWHSLVRQHVDAARLLAP